MKYAVVLDEAELDMINRALNMAIERSPDARAALDATKPLLVSLAARALIDPTDACIAPSPEVTDDAVKRLMPLLPVWIDEGLKPMLRDWAAACFTAGFMRVALTKLRGGRP